MEISEKEYKEYKMLLLKKELEVYAHDFLAVLDKELFYKRIPLDAVPIYVKIVDPIEHLKSGNAPAKMSFRPLQDGMQLVNVIIYITGYGDINYVKQSIRHEILHLALYINNLKDSDSDAVFKILCDRYDAYFYKKISGIEEKIYFGAQKYIEPGFTMMDTFKDKVVNCSVSKLISIIGNKDIKTEEDILVMKTELETEVNEIQAYIDVEIKKID